MKFNEFLANTFLSTLSDVTSVKVRDELDSAEGLGALEGVDLDSPGFSGYIYFWSKGFLDYALYDIQEDVEVIPVTVIEVKDYSLYFDKIATIISYFR